MEGLAGELWLDIHRKLLSKIYIVEATEQMEGWYSQTIPTQCPIYSNALGMHTVFLLIVICHEYFYHELAMFMM